MSLATRRNVAEVTHRYFEQRSLNLKTWPAPAFLAALFLMVTWRASLRRAYSRKVLISLTSAGCFNVQQGKSQGREFDAVRSDKGGKRAVCVGLGLLVCESRGDDECAPGRVARACPTHE